MEPDDVGVAVVDVLRPTIAALTDEVLSSVVEAVPPFTEWWGGTLDVRDGVDHGIRGFLELLEGGGAAAPERLPNHDVFFAFGRSELRASVRSSGRGEARRLSTTGGRVHDARMTRARFGELHRALRAFFEMGQTEKLRAA